MEFAVKILKTENLTHNVRRFELEKPENYSFAPGQATEVAINKPGWKNEKRPFTFTNLNDQQHLEFIIKRYPSHEGVTNALHELSVGDELLIHDTWGAIGYKGKGVFIAGGAGITPFIAIFRQLYRDKMIAGNKLIFSNRTSADIILKSELEKMLGTDFINILTHDPVFINPHKRINKQYLKEMIGDFSRHFYVCGPDKFTEDITRDLVSLGAETDSVIIEE